MRTLIIYGTKHGCTEKCCEMLKGRLQGECTVINAKEGGVPDLDAYDKVIIGGSIYVGKIQREITDFCTKNMEVLKKKKLGLFICCMLRKDEEMELNNAFPRELLNVAAAKGCFGGEFRFERMGMLEKMAVKMVSKSQGEPIIDTKKDISQLSEERINSFARLMNEA